MITSTAENILKTLIANENAWVSGQTLAKQLNLSRAAIWKAIANLTTDGFNIESQRGPGKGYRYIPNEKMSVTGIIHKLKFPIAVYVFDVLSSTNTFAKQALISEEITEPTAIIANVQTKGAGHFGRAFVSPAQTGLYISFALPLAPDSVVIPSLLATASAVAVARMLKQLLDIQIDFNWINDLYYHDKKVGGILTEAMVNFESQTYSALIVGIGLNLTNQQTELGAITDKLEISRNQIAACLINHFFALYNSYQDGLFLDDYRTSLLNIGKTVTIKSGQQVITGIAEGIDDKGQLLLHTPTGKIRLAGGEMLITQI
ncbi:bifunctional ligase/repressor BirA [Lactococcus hodotermopsidis]|uniref:Bifunctional ligase/repressor BirA n=1 Tax=Pseudolactococcus hodotermopsidis TaxID=2709157 RepID=A0A6A0BF00_9LACT|nr:biotin--[acetyl-CoA-carboxylase] ligase [Lactococcus hodotermopsidis]GFH43356.1 bifunctional ligase/repressor BirA [Lactococcus hodotermopsidis]